jgi:hypothetical protein
VFLLSLRGTTFRHHLSSIRMVNPIGLNRVLPAPQPIFLPLLVLFVVLCVFLMIFMRISHVQVSSLQFLSTPDMFLILFYVSMLKIWCFWVSIMLSLMCIIPQHMLLFELDILHIWFSIFFGLCFLDVAIYG